MSRISSIPTTRVSDAYAAQSLLAQVQYNQSKLTDLITQVSTGQKFLVPSQDPNTALRGIAINDLINRKTQIKTNLDSTLSYLQASDSTLASVNDQLQQAKSVALQSVGSTATDAERANAVSQIGHILDSVLSLANQSFAGQRLFAGSQTNATPFVYTPDGILYNGDAKAVSTYSDLAQLVQSNISGQQAFGAQTTPITSLTKLTPQLTAATPLAQLRGGQGIQLGSVFISDGTHVSTVNLSSAATIGDVARLIERNAPAGRTITAHVTQTGLTLQLDAAGGGNLSVADVGTSTTASDLGIVNRSGVGIGVLTGSALQPRLLPSSPVANVFGTRATGYVTSLGSANDLTFTAATSGSQFNGATIKYIDSSKLQSGPGIARGSETAAYTTVATPATAALNLPGPANDLILTATTAGTSYNGVTVQITNGGAIGDAANVSYNARSKTLTIAVDGTGQTSTQTLITAINGEGHFTAARDASGEPNVAGGFVLSQAIGRSGLGTYNTGNDPNTLAIKIQSGVSTANDVIRAVNAEGTFNASVDPSEPNNDGGGVVLDSVTNSTASAVTAGGGGAAFDPAGIQLVSAGKVHVVSFAGAQSVQDVLNSLIASTPGVSARINDAGTGIEISSNLSGANFSVGENGGQTATQLGIRTFTTTTPLATLNNGQGVNIPSGTSFTITRKDGVQLNINLTGALTVGDVLNAINNNTTNTASGTPVVARLNTFGNGIELTEDGPPSGNQPLLVTSPAGATTAQGLGLVAAGATTSVAPTPGVAAAGSLVSAGANNDLVFNAANAGTLVNNAQVVFTDTGGAAPSVSYNAGTNTLTFGIQSGVTTANQMIATLAADPTASQLFVASLAPADGAPNDGTGTVDVTATTTLTGGKAEVLSGSEVNPQQVSGVFTALLQLKAALAANDNVAIGKATDLLDASITKVSAARAEVGVREQTVTALQSGLSNENSQLTKAASQDLDVDMAQAISDLTQTQTSFQAALQVSGAISKLSLLNYI